MNTSGRGSRGRGFTIAEVLVGLGIIGILVSIWLPALGGAVEQSRRTADLATLRQNYTLVTLYAQDRQDVFPIAKRNPFQAGMFWYEALVRTGHLDEEAHADRRTWQRHGTVSFELSACLMYDPDLMLPGFTVSYGAAVARPVRIDQVVYPASKGAMVKYFNGIGHPRDGGVYFCCTHPWVVPVVMVDGSGEVGDYLRYSGGEPVAVIDGVGVPVSSTWGGYKARDK